MNDGCEQLAEAIQAIIDTEGSVSMAQIFALAQQGFGCGMVTVNQIAGGVSLGTSTGEIVIADEQIDHASKPSAFSQVVAFGLTLGELLAIGGAAVLLRRSM